MKKIIAGLSVALLLAGAVVMPAQGQKASATVPKDSVSLTEKAVAGKPSADSLAMDSTMSMAADEALAEGLEEAVGGESFHQMLKSKFIEIGRASCRERV